MKNFLFLLFLFFSSNFFGDESFDPTRSYLKDLKDDPKVKEDFYEDSFLFVVTAQKSKETSEQLFKKVQAYLKKAKLPFKGRYSTEKLPTLTASEQLAFPALSFEGKQLEGIQGCKKDYCTVKLLTETEKGKMEESKDKAALYKELIFARVAQYLKDGELVGYEERSSNIESLKLALKQLPFLASRYPKMNEFVQGRFLARKTQATPMVKNAFLRMEVMNMSGEKMQPVLRISEAFEFEENQTRLIFEPQIYTNHFFDTSMRFFEVLPFAESQTKSLLIMTDVMEVDELKKSGIIRALFKGKMVSGVHQYQADEISRIETEPAP